MILKALIFFMLCASFAQAQQSIPSDLASQIATDRRGYAWCLVHGKNPGLYKRENGQWHKGHKLLASNLKDPKLYFDNHQRPWLSTPEKTWVLNGEEWHSYNDIAEALKVELETHKDLNFAPDSGILRKNNDFLYIDFDKKIRGRLQLKWVEIAAPTESNEYQLILRSNQYIVEKSNIDSKSYKVNYIVQPDATLKEQYMLQTAEKTKFVAKGTSNIGRSYIISADGELILLNSSGNLKLADNINVKTNGKLIFTAEGEIFLTGKGNLLLKKTLPKYQLPVKINSNLGQLSIAEINETHLESVTWLTADGIVYGPDCYRGEAKSATDAIVLFKGLIRPQFISTKLYADKNLKKKIQLLIQQLSAGYKVRKSAKQELLAIGKPAIQPLASHKSEDFETRLMIKEILKELSKP